LLLAGTAAAAGAVLHLAIAIGGPGWYAFFGAPQGLVDMARAGNLRAPFSCVVIAAFLSLLAAYAFSGAGVIRRLPFLRPVLAAIAALLIVRGASFVPLILWRPGALAGVCDCRRVDAFIVVTSLLCLAMGVGYALGAARNENGARHD
jgi:putative oxidoreductase